jgi:hypothetical protein
MSAFGGRVAPTHNQGELDLYKEMAPAALAGHPITFRIAHGHKEVVEGPDFEDMMCWNFQPFGRRELGMTARPTKRQANIGSKVPIIAPSSLKASRPNNRGFSSCAKSCMTSNRSRGCCRAVRSSTFRWNAMNPDLPRLKPNPIPKIAPIPEHLAEPALREIYEDTKAALQVPWMAVVAMSFARYPRFYATLWGGFRELSASAQFLAACHELRREAESASLSVPSILRKLHELGYTEPEIAEIRALIEIFSHGNMPYLLIATAARLLLEGNEIGTSRSISKPVQSRHGPAAGGKLVLMEPHHAERQLQALYDDLKSTIDLPFLNTDYRALARWPSYFDVAWRSLKLLIGTPAYDEAVERVHKKAVALVLALPNPGQLTRARLVAAADEDTGAESVLNVVRLFQWLLPGLVVNVACMREQTLPS